MLKTLVWCFQFSCTVGCLCEYAESVTQSTQSELHFLSTKMTGYLPTYLVNVHAAFFSIGHCIRNSHPRVKFLTETDT